VTDDRLARLRDAMAQRGLDAFVSTKFVNTYYLSGFTSLDTGRPTTYTLELLREAAATGSS
jgi:Xaa-Pro aminopeptidase